MPISPIIRETVESAMRGLLYRALSGAQGNVTKAARSIGTTRTSFCNLMKRYGIKVERRVPPPQK